MQLSPTHISLSRTMGSASTSQLPEPDCIGGQHPILLFQTNPDMVRAVTHSSRSLSLDHTKYTGERSSSAV